MIFHLHRKRSAVIGSLLFLATQTVALAQDAFLGEMLPGFKERAVVLDIVARVVEQDQQEVWNSFNSKITIPGRPVGLRLVGANIVIAVQFTPYLRPNGNNILVVQGQIWVNIPNKGMHYQSIMQTIAMEFGEQIYFFPLGGSDSKGEARIEIQLELHPYNAGPSTNVGNGQTDEPDKVDSSTNGETGADSIKEGEVNQPDKPGGLGNEIPR
ncbi:MAG: hypothetical protein LBQ88_13015 [Treponema sp.]|jgi:hypothetical protein|nr:hypothetical protein [Treponema sp.]